MGNGVKILLLFNSLLVVLAYVNHGVLWDTAAVVFHSLLS